MANILVVDDITDITDMLQILLEDDGHKVVSANSAAEARTKIQSGQYQILITDIMMPEENGLELIKTLKALKPQNSNLKIITMSGGGTIPEPKALSPLDMALGLSDAVLKKPFTKETLNRAVGDALST